MISNLNKTACDMVFQGGSAGFDWSYGLTRLLAWNMSWRGSVRFRLPVVK
jgi:hypothetical protein